MSHFAKIAAQVAANVKTGTATDNNAEWQRVNSYIADVLKDSHVLYAKLARLQGDFVGEEFDRLAKISEAVLHIGDELSSFSKAFYEGKYDMAQTEFSYGNPGPGQGGGGGGGQGPAPQQAPQGGPPAPQGGDQGGGGGGQGGPAPAPEGGQGGGQGQGGGDGEPMAFGDSGGQGQGGQGGQEQGPPPSDDDEPPAEDYSGEDDSDEEDE